MDTINYDTHNILLNGQPYPIGSVRLVYPTIAGDNQVTILFPWWRMFDVLWRGDVTRLINGQTKLPFASLADFQAFADAHFYSPWPIYPVPPIVTPVVVEPTPAAAKAKRKPAKG